MSLLILLILLGAVGRHRNYHRGGDYTYMRVTRNAYRRVKR